MMEKVAYFWSKTNRWHRGFLLFLLVEMQILPAGKRGFNCNDPALSHPFNGDTISWKLLLATTVFLPLPVILIVERLYHSGKPTKPKQQAVHWYKEYLFGLLVNLIVTQLLKLLVGSPRPHFFDTCSPQEALTCSGSEYVSRYTCTKAHWITQSDKSFPSGHTSLAVHAGFFLAWYLHRRTSSPTTRRVMVLQLVFTSLVVMCGISRMLDHRHHAEDVLGGTVLAVPIVIYTIFYLCSNFECAEDTSKADCTNNTNEKDVTETLVNNEINEKVQL